jgi:hypothetical protein
VVTLTWAISSSCRRSFAGSETLKRAALPFFMLEIAIAQSLEPRNTSLSERNTLAMVVKMPRQLRRQDEVACICPTDF